MQRTSEKRSLIWLAYLRAMGKWLGIALITGALCGLCGTLFHMGVQRATELRAAQPWLLYTLPALGLLIVGIYKRLGTEGQTTNAILDEIRFGDGVPAALLPSVFFATLLTHLGGGSVGREGAALQMGGAIGYQSGRLLRLDDSDLRTMTTVGMAAFFAALFGTPVTAAVFALEITTVGRLYFTQLFPCLVAALTACGLSTSFGVAPTVFFLEAPFFNAVMLTRVALLAVLSALLSIAFCKTIHVAERLASAKLPNPWLRIFTGGSIIVALTLLLGTTDYNGAGMEVIARAVERGEAFPAAFLLKLVFTALSLAAGYKGGEVVPAFFVGATFGCLVAPFLGVPATFGAAIGLVSVFCGVVNCPLSSIFLAVELFGGAGLPYFALTCAVSFVLSGYSGIYASQRILYNKLKTDYVKDEP